jgi:pimeloyl-ACP methyl ester carboxylesterase
MPVLAIHGEADTTVGASIHSERLVEDVEDGELVLLDGVGHMPHHAAPEAAVAAIERVAAAAGLR